MNSISNDYWILGGTIVTMNKNREILESTDIHVQDDKISSILAHKDNSENWTSENSIDASGKVILPGFINCHTHADCIMARGGFSQDMSLFDWLVHVTDPVRQTYSEEDLEAAIELYCHEAIRSGITYLVDLVGFVEDWRHAVVLGTYEKMGLRVAYAPMFMDQVPRNNQEVFETSSKEGGMMPPVESADQLWMRIQRFLENEHLRANGKIKVWVTPRLGRATTPAGLRKSVEVAKAYNTITTTHCSETKAEFKGSNITTVEYLEESGYLSERTVLAHCVWLTDQDIDKIKRTGTKVAHCPSTNLFLGSGIAPVSKLLDAGIQVGLGTDNANANDTVNMWTEMRNAACLQKGVCQSASAMTAEEALEMATIQGARVVGEDENIGSIEVGKKADIIIVDTKATNLVPMHHIPSTFVYQSLGTEVSDTIVGGKILMRNRELICCPPNEEQRFLEMAQKKSEELAARARLDFRRSHSWISRIKP